MKVAIFGSKSYDKKFFNEANKQFNYELIFIESHLNAITAPLAKSFDSVCAFVNDELDGNCLKTLSAVGIRSVVLRCAGFNNVDLTTAKKLGIKVARVPEYSPHGVAEHAVALILALNRKIYKSYNRVRENNFSLEGLLGFNLNSKTIGVIGTGKIGTAFCEIMIGFGCSVLAYDPNPSKTVQNSKAKYTELDDLLSKSDIISLHCPLTPDTYHMIDDNAISLMKNGIMLINTSRGALINTSATIKHLKSGKIGYLGLDVYEEEADLFFEDISNEILADDIFARLLTFPNVLITGHQAFFTSNALEKIAQTTLLNIKSIQEGLENSNIISNV
jgi:D-lactate dehydrogenase